MKTNNNYLALDLTTHRRKMLQFVWIIIGGLLLSAYALPFATGEQQVFPVRVQLIFFGYLIFCFVLSRLQSFFWLTPHFLLSGMLLLFVATCMLQEGINTPASHFIPLIPALCSLLMSSRATIIYGLITGMSIALLTITEAGFSIRHASTYDLLNAVTLILSTVVITAGVVFIAKHNEKLIGVFKGKSGYDDLTGLPNRYYLRKQFEQAVHTTQETDAENPGIITIGIDGFVEYNREHGEQAGDMILVQAAHTISSLVPATDHFVVGRTQGNSFAVIFSSASDDQLRFISTKIQTGFEALSIAGNNDQPMSVSIAILKFLPESSLPNGTDALIKGHKSLLAAQSKGAKQIAKFNV